MTKPMTAQEALDLAILTMEKLAVVWEGHVDNHEAYKQAAHILRNGTEPVEVVESGPGIYCSFCRQKTMIRYDSRYGTFCDNCNNLISDVGVTFEVTKRYTTYERIRIINVGGPAVYEEEI